MGNLTLTPWTGLKQSINTLRRVVKKKIIITTSILYNGRWHGPVVLYFCMYMFISCIHRVCLHTSWWYDNDIIMHYYYYLLWYFFADLIFIWTTILYFSTTHIDQNTFLKLFLVDHFVFSTHEISISAIKHIFFVGWLNPTV
jgi:hypothetical protein